MKQVDGWWFPDHERHLIDWMANPKGRKIINGRSAYQGKKQLAAMELVPADRRRTAIDVGAHIGLWSFNLAHWFKRVEAFEPVAAHRECWQANMSTRQDEVSLHPYALGDREAMVAIHTADTSSGDSWVKGKGSIPMKTLDSFHFEDVDFIKIDCEGYEEFVLRGATSTIMLWRPVICVEQKRDMAAKKFGLETLGAVKFLQDLGYRQAIEISGDHIMVPA
jgi:FkbM family methyltransferase